MNLLNVLIVLAQAPGQSPWITPVFMFAMIGVMYFFLIRPQVKRAKQQKEFANATNVGDTVVTSAGIYGKIIKINEDDTVSLEVDRNTILKLDKNSISMEMTQALRKKNQTA